MDINVRDNRKHEFVPVTFEFTCTTEDELRMLWHCLNIAPAELRDASCGARVKWPENARTAKTDMFNAVDEVVVRRGLKED